MQTKPDVVLFTAPQCPHCPQVKQAFSQFEQQGLIQQLTIYSADQSPDLADQYQIRSVPWFRIGALTFTGQHTAKEIQHWLQVACTEQGIYQYVTETLEAGRLAQVEQLIEQHPDTLCIAIKLIADNDAPLQARIGIGALIEGWAHQPILEKLLPQLTQSIASDDHRHRSDACYYLGMVNHPTAQQLLQQCLEDEHPEVREIAQESLEALSV